MLWKAFSNELAKIIEGLLYLRIWPIKRTILAVSTVAFTSLILVAEQNQSYHDKVQ